MKGLFHTIWLGMLTVFVLGWFLLSTGTHPEDTTPIVQNSVAFIVSHPQPTHDDYSLIVNVPSLADRGGRDAVMSVSRENYLRWHDGDMVVVKITLRMGFLEQVSVE